MWFDPALVASRLAALVPELLTVGTARDLGAAQLGTLRAPSAWVVVLSESAGEVRYEVSELIEQVVTVRFAVILALRDLGDRSGALAGADLLALRPAVHRVLCGWMPPDANTCPRFQRGALVGGVGRDGMMLWQDEFSVTFDRRHRPEAQP